MVLICKQIKALPVNIDGYFSPLEWGDAVPGYNFNFADTSDPTNPLRYVLGRLFVKNDGTNLYFLILINVAPPSSNSLFIGFDINGSSTLNNSDDVLIWDRSLSPGIFRDLFYNGDSLTLDTSYSGTNDGEAAQQVYTGPDEGYTAIEFSHPLNSSDDAHDINLILDATIDFLMGFYYQGIDYDGYSYMSPVPGTGFFTLDVNGSSPPSLYIMMVATLIQILFAAILIIVRLSTIHFRKMTIKTESEMCVIWILTMTAY